MTRQSKRLISQIAKDHCVAHADEFERETQASVLDTLENRYWLTMAALFTAAAANVPFAGYQSFFFLLPALMAAAIPPLFHWSAKRSFILQRFASVYFDSVFFLAVGGLSLLWMYILDLGIRPKDSPVQFAIAVVCMLSTHSRFSKILIRNVGYCLLMASVFGLRHPEFLAESISQFIGGFGIGAWLAMMRFDSQRIQFYTNSVQRRLNTHLLSELECLVYEHQKLMLEKHYHIEDTMRLDSQLGYLGEFDIIGSTKLQDDPRFEIIKNKIFAKCYDRLLKNYQLNPTLPAAPYADGHMVKEMGDGFIFSVGYPFTVPGARNPADIAMQLGMEFTAYFQELAQEFELATPPRCAISLIKTDLRAFWTYYKVKRYDFEQKSVTKLARVSELRRSIQDQVFRFADSFVLLEESIIPDLSRGYTSQLEKILLDPLSAKVRDYPSIKSIFVKRIESRRFKKAA